MSTIAPAAFRIAQAHRPFPKMPKFLKLELPKRDAVAGWKKKSLTTGERVQQGIYAAASGGFSYLLFTGTTPFSVPHPIWGSLFALSAITHLGTAAAGTDAEWDDTP